MRERFSADLTERVDDDRKCCNAAVKFAPKSFSLRALCGQRAARGAPRRLLLGLTIYLCPASRRGQAEEERGAPGDLVAREALVKLGTLQAP